MSKRYVKRIQYYFGPLTSPFIKNSNMWCSYSPILLEIFCVRFSVLAILVNNTLYYQLSSVFAQFFSDLKIKITISTLNNLNFVFRTHIYLLHIYWSLLSFDIRVSVPLCDTWWKFWSSLDPLKYSIFILIRRKSRGFYDNSKELIQIKYKIINDLTLPFCTVMISW